jgi:Tfp pilus assembly protein PilF
VAWIILRLLQKQPLALYATGAVILVFLGIQSWRQTLLYRDNFTMWSDVLAKNPNAWLAHGNLAHELLAMHRDDEAGEHLRKQLELAPPDQVEVIVQYAQYLATHGHFEESLPYFHRGIELDPDYLNTYGFLGQALVAHGRIDEAIKLYEDALAKHPEFEPGWIDLAQIYENRGDLAHAAETYERAIHAIPNTVTARVNLANLYLNARQPQPAMKLLSEAAAIDDNNADVHNRYGLLLLSLGRYPEAVEQFERMVQLTKGKPGAHIAYHNLGTALEGAGRISEAVASYQRALAIKPDFAPAKRSLDRAMGKAQSQ